MGPSLSLLFRASHPAFSPDHQPHWLAVTSDLPPLMQKQQPSIELFTSSSLQLHDVKALKSLGFPGGVVVKNLPADAGHMGSSPGLGRSHMPRSNWAREPQLLSLRVWSLRSATREATIVRGPHTVMKSGPPLAATRESPRTETKTQHSQR